jgi:hypothetical protein
VNIQFGEHLPLPVHAAVKKGDEFSAHPIHLSTDRRTRNQTADFDRHDSPTPDCPAPCPESIECQLESPIAFVISCLPLRADGRRNDTQTA